jgi:DNA-binding NarL/FixJ family response regulator
MQKLSNFRSSIRPFILNTAINSCIRIGLVDDDIGFQSELSTILTPSTGILLQGIASTRAEGLKMLDMPQMDVLIVDLGLPDGSGIDVMVAANKKWPTCNLMVSTTFGDELHVMQSLEAGATGYLLKDSAPKNLINEIKSLHSGGSPISPLIARKILTRFHQSPPRPALPDNRSVEKLKVGLSNRELEVLEYITKGFSSNEIAALMAVSPHTVLTFIRRVYAKLKVTSKTEVIYEARNQGILG